MSWAGASQRFSCLQRQTGIVCLPREGRGPRFVLRTCPFAATSKHESEQTLRGEPESNGEGGRKARHGRTQAVTAALGRRPVSPPRCTVAPEAVWVLVGGVLELQWGRGSSILCFSHPCCSPSARSPQPVTQPSPTGCESLQTSFPCRSHRRSPPPHTRLRSPCCDLPGTHSTGGWGGGGGVSPLPRAQGHNQLAGLFVPTTG